MSRAADRCVNVMEEVDVKGGGLINALGSWDYLDHRYANRVKEAKAERLRIDLVHALDSFFKVWFSLAFDRFGA